jgi:hypothetical protein
MKKKKKKIISNKPFILCYHVTYRQEEDVGMLPPCRGIGISQFLFTRYAAGVLKL